MWPLSRPARPRRPSPSTFPHCPCPVPVGPASCEADRSAADAGNAGLDEGLPEGRHARRRTQEHGCHGWHLCPATETFQSPDGNPSPYLGPATRKVILGDRVVVENVSSQIMGRPHSGQGRHGFDNVTGKYWEALTYSMSAGLMISEGNCDANRSCSCTGLFHDPVSMQPQTARMTSRRADKKTELFKMHAPGAGRKGIQDDVDHLQQAPPAPENCNYNCDRNRN